MTTAAAKRTRFRELHDRSEVFVMPNPWDIGSARLLESVGFDALASTSAGLAWSLGRDDMNVQRDELVAHVAALAGAVEVPLNVDAERCFAESLDGIAETATMLAQAGASGFSIEDWNPAADRIDDISAAAERVAAVAEVAHRSTNGLVLTARAENHLHGVTDFDDTLARLVAYRDAGADAVYAPGLVDLDQIRTVVDVVGLPVNVLALPGGPTVEALGAVGVRRVSIGGSLAKVAYGAMLRGARELLEQGTSTYTAHAASNADLHAARFTLDSEHFG